MTSKRKVIQLTLIFVGLSLGIFTYFLYPTNNKSKLLEVEKIEKKSDIKEEIKILEKKEQAIINQIEETKEYLSSSFTVEKQKTYIFKSCRGLTAYL